MFDTLVNTSLIGIEKICNYSNYNVDGLTEELMKDPSFQYDLRVLQCEIDASKYINVKTSCFLKVVKKIYTKNQENKMKQQINDINNDKDILNKINNIQLKK